MKRQGEPEPAAAQAEVSPELAQRLRVGERLRRLRHLRKLTLEHVAGEVDLSVSFLSMLERGQADISMSRFSRLAQFYRISPSELLLEDDSSVAPTLVRADEAPLIDRGPGVTYRLLCRNHNGVQAMRVTFEVGAAFQDLLAHQGSDFVWVVKGELTLLYGDREYPVRAHEFIQYEATQPHGFRNSGRSIAEMIAFINAPYW